MRVLFYVSSSTWSAAARVAITAAKGLAAKGHEVAVACAEGSQLAARTSDARIDAVTMGKSASAAGDAWDLRRAMEHRSIEVAIVTSERDHLVVASARLLGNRGAVLRHVRPLERVQLGRGGKIALKLAASGLIYSSEKDATEATNLKGWAVPPCVAPLGVDPSPFDAAEPMPRGDVGLANDALLIACSYEPSGRARIATVLRALALLTPRHPELHAVVFGPGSLDEALRMHASALAVGASITFLGEVDDAPSVMRAANIGWVAAEGDAGAYACLDAMACRLPVIAERNMLTQQYVADGITGLLLAQGDPPDTASEVAEFIADRARCAAMGNAGRARVQREFSETAMIDGFERAINAAGDRVRQAS
jgi:glycosyltransferase involved in cell wall biosynthesis